VRTAFEQGWSTLSNGILLARASEAFDVFVTVDQNVQYQQNLKALPLPVIMLVVPNNRFESLAPLAPATLEVLSRPLPREVVRVGPPPAKAS